MKSTLSSKISCRTTIVAVCASVAFCLTALSLAPATALAQTELTAPATAGTNAAMGQVGDIGTFWSLTKMGGGISFAIFGILALGIFLITLQIYELTTDRSRGRQLLETNYRQYSVNDVTRIVKNSPNSLIARLYSVLLSIFHTTGNTNDFHDEIANYIQLQQDRFGTFKSRLSFLSDTAGALGLLGTVWGMFVTFFGGNLDSQRILNGMGLALVTTLIGLVVSMILNFCATEIFSVFNKRMELVSTKADEFRLWLMIVIHQRERKSGTPLAGGGTSNNRKKEQATPAPTKRAPVPSLQLQAVSDFQQDGVIGQILSKPIIALVESSNGQKVAGVPVHFQVTQGGGLLAGKHSAALVKTNKNGLASLEWTMGQEVGAQRLAVFLPDDRGSQLEFAALAQPFIPDLEKPAKARASREKAMYVS